MQPNLFRLVVIVEERRVVKGLQDKCVHSKISQDQISWFSGFLPVNRFLQKIKIFLIFSAFIY